VNLSDRELLARTLQAEAGNQGPTGLLAAGSVIMNRANMPGYGDGVRGAILAPGQFSAWNSVTGYAGGEQGQNMETMRPGQDAYAAADQLLSGEYQDPTGGATHYYNPSISNPAWGRDRAGGDWQQIGDHIFGFADAGRENSTRGAPQMAMQPTQPQGLLGQLGIQRRDPTAQGETALPFYQRDRFSNTMGNLAMAFNTLRQRPDENIPRIVTGQRAAREQDSANNRTVEWLSSQPGGERFAGLVESIGAAAALQAYQQAQPAPAYQTVRGSEIGLEGPAGDRLYNVAPDGKITAIGGGDINAGPLGTPLTAGEEAVDKAFAQEFFEQMTTGGADTAGQLATIGSVLQTIEEGENISGPGVAALGNFGRAIFNPEAQEAKDLIEGVIQRSLRETLGGQFAEREGERLIQRGFNIALSPAQNARRLRLLFARLQSADEVKRGMLAHFQTNGTIRGYEGPTLPTASELIAAMDAPISDTPSPTGDTPSPSGVAVIRYDAQGNRIE